MSPSVSPTNDPNKGNPEGTNPPASQGSENANSNLATENKNSPAVTPKKVNGNEEEVTLLDLYNREHPVQTSKNKGSSAPPPPGVHSPSQDSTFTFKLYNAVKFDDETKELKVDTDYIDSVDNPEYYSLRIAL